MNKPNKSKDPIVEQVVKPNHYTSSNDVIDFCLNNNIGFCEGNVIKYVRRWREKNGIEDLEKAKEYINRLIQDERRRQNKSKQRSLIEDIMRKDQQDVLYE